MGRVFSYEQIALEQIPDESDFIAARLTFEAVAADMAQAEIIDGAFIFGSVAIGAATRRSDFDAFVAIPDVDTEYWRAVKELTDTTKEATNNRVPIVPIVQSRDALIEGRHEMDRLFGKHLSSPHRIVIGFDPASLIRYSDETTSSIFAGYLAEKKRRLANAYNNTLDLHSGELVGLQRMLELPVAIGRKALQAFSDHDAHRLCVEKSADKSLLHSPVRELMTEFGLEEGYDDAVEANRSYDEILEITMKGELDHAGYNDELRDLHERLPNALIWIDQLEREMLPKLS